MNEVQFRLRPRSRGEMKVAVPERGKRPRIAEVLALAISFDDLIGRGLAKDYSDLARLGCLSKERISQVMRLLLLAPEIQQEILTLPQTPHGRFPVGEVALRQIASRLLWSEQRQMWNHLQEAVRG